MTWGTAIHLTGSVGRKSFVATTASLLALPLLLGATACHHEADASQGAGGGGAPKLPVDVVTLADEPIRDGAEYLAQLVSRHQVAIYPQVSGVVSSISVKPGQVVKQGTPLVQIDPRKESANLANQQAAKVEREANFALAKRNEARSAALYREGLVSKQQLDTDQSQMAIAQSEVSAQDAVIGAQAAELGYYRIVAPFDGIVGDIPIKLGDYVGPTSKLTSVDDNANLEAYVNIPAENLKLINDASRIDILGDPGTNQLVAEAPISFIAEEANPQTQAILIKAKFPNGGSLRAAQLVRSRVVWKTHQGVRVPSLALIRQSGQYFVFVAQAGEGGQVVHQVPVTLGELDNSTYAVMSGLKAGDQVVVSQVQKLRDGAPVATSPAKPPPATSGSAAAPVTPAAPATSASDAGK